MTRDHVGAGDQYCSRLSIIISCMQATLNKSKLLELASRKMFLRSLNIFIISQGVILIRMLKSVGIVRTSLHTQPGLESDIAMDELPERSGLEILLVAPIVNLTKLWTFE